MSKQQILELKLNKLGYTLKNPKSPLVRLSDMDTYLLFTIYNQESGIETNCRFTFIHQRLLSNNKNISSVTPQLIAILKAVYSDEINVAQIQTLLGGR